MMAMGTSLHRRLAKYIKKKLEIAVKNEDDLTDEEKRKELLEWPLAIKQKRKRKERGGG